KLPEELFRYVGREEPEFAWSTEEKTELGDITVYRLKLVSQTWHDIIWEHALMVYVPQEIAHPEQMLLFVTGGKIGGGMQFRDHGDMFGLDRARRPLAERARRMHSDDRRGGVMTIFFLERSLHGPEFVGVHERIS
ncbi:MAG: PhoPQ-activated protein PqaA family protein, partial [Planctomycetaceae bacterium]